MEPMLLRVFRVELGRPGQTVGWLASSAVSITGETSTATTRRQHVATAQVNCPVPEPRSTTVESAFKPAAWRNATSLAAPASIFESYLATRRLVVPDGASGVGVP